MELWVRVFSTCGLLGVALGAFGAHGLKNKVTADDLEIWKTAALYLFVHVLAGLFATTRSNQNALYAFLAGIVLFSGSLFTLVLTQQRWLGAVTPLGGVAFLVGWFFLILQR